MNILVIYGTTEGQTRKIASFMQQQLQTQGHQVMLADANEQPPLADEFDAIIIGSSVHMHHYHSAVEHYIKSNLKALNTRPSAFYSVSMAIASDNDEEHSDIKQLATDFLFDCGLKTVHIFHIAGALKYTQYDYFKRLVMRMIAKKEGGNTDTSKDHEYTDWSQVKQQTLDFVAQINPK